MTDERVEKWRRWIDGQMKPEILTMHLYRDTWQQVQEIIRVNGSLPDSYWWEFMRETYAVTQAVAVRRQIDKHRDVATLGKLISEITEDAALVTRDSWLGLWDQDDPIDVRFAQRKWDEHFGGSIGEHLDPAIPMSDLVALESASNSVKRYVDRHLAHSDTHPIPAADLPTVSDMHEVIDQIGFFYNKYTYLLKAATWGTLVPVMQHDWKAAFRQPWISP
jgi:hypothetical protein